MSTSLIIFGTAEIASLAHYYFTKDSAFNITAFTVDDDYVEQDNFEGLPVVPFSEAKNRYSADEHRMHVALSYNKLNTLRAQKYHQAKDAGYKLVNYISSKATDLNEGAIGDNCFILEDQTIQPRTQIGNNVMLWSGNHIGHGSVIGDHTYISSHVVISGHCTIGERCFFGVNATIADFTSIGNDVFVAMNAAVSQNIADGGVALAPSSSILKQDDKLAMRIKRKYFGV